MEKINIDPEILDILSRIADASNQEEVEMILSAVDSRLLQVYRQSMGTDISAGSGDEWSLIDVFATNDPEKQELVIEDEDANQMRYLLRLRNIGISETLDAGKTTFTEHILRHSDTTDKTANTSDRNSHSDWIEQEKDRDISIPSVAVSCQWSLPEHETPGKNDKYNLNIIDIPRHLEFTGEMERSLRAVDGLLLLFSAIKGVEPQIENLWLRAEEYHLPRICFINKMDHTSVDFIWGIHEIEQTLGRQVVLLQLPLVSGDGFSGLVDLVKMNARIWKVTNGDLIHSDIPIPDEMKEEAAIGREKLIAAIQDYDERLLEKFFDDPATITETELHEAIRKATLDLEIVPVMFGAGFKNIGIHQVLDAVCRYLPSPADIGAVIGADPKTGEITTREPDLKEPFSAFAFKIINDPFTERLTFIRCYSGKLIEGNYLQNIRSGRSEPINRIVKIFGNKKKQVSSITAGEIGVIVGLHDIRSGDTLCDGANPVVFKNMFIHEPVVSLVIQPKTQADLDKMNAAISRLMEEDPDLQINVDTEIGQATLRGMSELHLETSIDRMKREFKINLNIGASQVNYKETFQTTVEHHQVFKEFSGGRGRYADIQFTIGPADYAWLEANPGEPLQFINDIPGNTIPNVFEPAIRKGFESAMTKGVMAGYPMANMKVRVFGGNYHPVDSDNYSFEMCAKAGFREAGRKAKPTLLEPVMKLNVVIPEQYMGDVIGDLNRRRGLLEGIDNQGFKMMIIAQVPMSELLGYAIQLHALASGRAGINTMIFSHYAQVPGNVAEEVVAKDSVKMKTKY